MSEHGEFIIALILSSFVIVVVLFLRTLAKILFFAVMMAIAALLLKALEGGTFLLR